MAGGAKTYDVAIVEIVGADGEPEAHNVVIGAVDRIKAQRKLGRSITESLEKGEQEEHMAYVAYLACVRAKVGNLSGDFERWLEDFLGMEIVSDPDEEGDAPGDPTPA